MGLDGLERDSVPGGRVRAQGAGFRYNACPEKMAGVSRKNKRPDGVRSRPDGKDAARMKENQQIEWKSSWRDDYLRWICGFANAEGGHLVIGRDDRGIAIGVEDAGRLMEEIPNKVRDILGIMADVNLRQEEGRDLVEVRVNPYPNPISYKGEYYYRSGSTNQMLKGAALDRFLLRKHGRTWDGVPLPGLTLTDLDAEALKDFRRLAQKSQRLPEAVLEEPDRNLLDKLHLVEGTYLTRAAALLFHPEPERFFTGAYVKIGYFESNADLRYQDEVQ